MSGSFDLTFGVELEFIVVHREAAFTACCSTSASERDDGHCVSAVEAIQFCLERSGVGAILSDQYNDEDEDIALSQDPSQRYRNWTVTKDHCELSRGERAHLPQNYVEQTVELSSRVFGFKDGDFHEELARVLSVLNKMKLEFGCEIFANSTTGLHVHIGRRNGAELPLRLCKRVFQLVTAHERNIDAMHMASRVLAPVSAKRFTHNLLPHYTPPSAVHRHTAGDSADTNVFEWLERIERVGSVRTLKEMFKVCLNKRRANGHFSAYNFDNLEGIKNTIEFRQHAGTLDLVEVVAWVSFVCRLVEYCCQTHDVRLMHLLCRATDMDFKLVDLLVALEVHTDVLMHYSRDGGEALLGFLPASHTYRRRDSFVDLIAQNDLEQGLNITPETVNEIIARKTAPNAGTSVSYTGLIPSAGVIYCHEAEHLRQLLEKAYDRAQRTEQSPVEPGNAAIGLEGYARALVFEKLSSIYADQPSGPEEAVRRHLAHWQ